LILSDNSLVAVDLEVDELMVEACPIEAPSERSVK
jgi:hypothetical protein